MISSFREWLHTRKSSTDFTKSQTILYNLINHTIWKYCKIAFIWMFTHQGFIERPFRSTPIVIDLRVRGLTLDVKKIGATTLTLWRLTVKGTLICRSQFLPPIWFSTLDVSSIDPVKKCHHLSELNWNICSTFLPLEISIPFHPFKCYFDVPLLRNTSRKGENTNVKCFVADNGNKGSWN